MRRVPACSPRPSQEPYRGFFAPDPPIPRYPRKKWCAEVLKIVAGQQVGRWREGIQISPNFSPRHSLEQRLPRAARVARARSAVPLCCIGALGAIPRPRSNRPPPFSSPVFRRLRVRVRLQAIRQPQVHFQAASSVHSGAALDVPAGGHASVASEVV